MAAEPPNTAQRHYRAPCPGCGAPVEFRSAQSAYAVCSYCQSTVVRQGEVLSRIGKMAELFDDHSPLQLLATGRIAEGGQDTAFTLIGRLQYRSGNGTWTEWAALLADGSTAWLGEDNGAYVFTRPLAVKRTLPEAAQFRVGITTAIDGRRYAVASNDQAALIAAEGELPALPPLGQPFTVVELRSAEGEVLSIDYGATPPAVSRGRAVRLEDLKLSGLREDSAREEKARQFACPNCGAPVDVARIGSQSVTCPACHSIIDLRQGLGGELQHALQDDLVRPLIPLGSNGRLQGVEWQAVGFQHRMGQEAGDDEQFGWTEYLLYHRERGFIFLVDAEDGWSVVRPITGAPLVNASRGTAVHEGTVYEQQYSYRAETTYVEGEFYWPVERGQITQNTDYAAGSRLLSSERARTEITWSAGSKIASDAVAQAFRLDPKQKDLLRRADASPLSAAAGLSVGMIVVIVVVVLILLVLLSTCSSSSGGGSGSGYRSSGGSYGGYSSGGGHK